MLDTPVYLDNNATTRVDDCVVQAMMPFWDRYYGNPSSVHNFGAQLRPVIDQAREQVASLMNAEPAEVCFTSGGTESDNWALAGSLASRRGRDHIVTTSVEHVAILETCERLAKQGTRITYVPVSSDGSLDLQQLAASLTPQTAVVSVMHANNETGVIFPIAEVARVIRESGTNAWLHVDAVQTLGKLPINVAELGVDLLSGSAHKLHGPKGIGCLFIRRGLRLKPMLLGGHQERDRRPGTENVAGIVGFGAAAGQSLQLRDNAGPRMQALRDRLEAGLVQAIPDIHINGAGQPRMPNTSNIGFIGVEAEPILIMLSEQGIAASAGSACTSGSLEPSHVLKAMGLPQEVGHGSIRFSLSRYTTEQEIDRVLAVMPKIIERLRSLNAAPAGA